MVDLTVEDVATMVNKLSKLGLLEILQVGATFSYRAIESQEALKMASMEPEELLVYKQIMASGDSGIWVRNIKNATNLHQQVVTRCIKQLENKGMIKSVKSVKNPTRKLYMLVDIKPSTEISGGPWFTDQELDTDFIDQLANQCYRYIYSKSVNRLNPNAIYSASYLGFPTAAQVRKFIVDNKVSTVDLGLEDIKSLLNVLIYDGKVEKIVPMGIISGIGQGENDVEYVYRAIVNAAADSPLTEVPCGNCPVYNICSSDGEVSPSNCTYFQKWLNY
ncbi:putative DNA-directed RNA polymerase III subunit rpc6 [Smittium mucronatum]|uniref:DNA-directed RNA polymerase III subunit RPC6 n=1 Tax=Smittium mucronatum TaxID=133383 RepID=A0A1R0H8H6_9FUNG|nr:putative DNA-directed RNA polymerase III subunit rpc6 [Smittium mucronatum]